METSVSHLEDVQQTGPEQSLAHAVSYATAQGQAIRMRVSIQLWDGKQYLSWKGQIWRVDAATEQDIRDIKEAMELLFDSLAVSDAPFVRDQLTEVLNNAQLHRDAVVRAQRQHEQQASDDATQP